MRVLGGRRVVAAVFVAGVAGLASGVLGPASADTSDELGYPSSIGPERNPDDLPEAPGRMSGAFVGYGAPTSMASATTGTTFLVSETGRAYRLPQTDDVIGYVPALSPDGSRVGYFPDPDGYVIRDLVSGETTTFARIEPGIRDQVEPYVFEGSRALWSPGGTRLLLFTEPSIVLALDGTITEAPRPRGRWAYPVGWIDDELAWIRWRGSDIDHPESGELVVAPVAGGPGRTVPLDDVTALSEVVKADVAVSPDGSSLAVVTPDTEESGRFTVYSTVDGSVTDRSTVDHGINTNCPLSWASGEPAVAGSWRSDALLAMSGETLVRSRDQFPPCSVWAVDALSGHRHPVGLVASVSARPTYLVVVGAVAVVAAVGWFLVRRRRSAREDDRDPGDGAAGAAPGDPPVVE